MSTNRDLSLQLTRKGLIAAICAAAEPFIVPACQVTVYDTVNILQERGVRTTRARICREHVSRYGLCTKHAADRDRLTGGAA